MPMRRLPYLALTLILAAPAAHSQDKDKEKNEELELLLAEYKKLNAVFQVDMNEKERPIIGIDFRKTEVEDNSLKKIHLIATLQWIDVRGTKITDEGISHLKEMTPENKYHLKKL